MYSNKTFHFYYSASSIGGVQTLFLRTAVALKQKGANVTIYGKNIEGYYKTDKKIIEDNNLTVTKISNLNWFFKLFSFSKNDNVITVASYYLKLWFLTSLFLKFKKKLWCVHPLNFIRFRNYFYLKWFHVLITKFYVKFLNENKYIKFMDYSCVAKTQEEYNITFKKVNYWPISKYINIQNHISKEVSNKINLLWVGRFSQSWKTDCLKPLLKIFNKQSMTLTLVGSGEIPNFISKKISDHPEIELLIDMKNTQLINIYKDFDLVFGMGTILIEASSKSVPSFSLDLKDSSGYGLWFYQRKGYSLGGYDEVSNNPKKIKIQEAINQINSGNKKYIGNKCFEHVYQNHNIVYLIDLITNPKL